MKARSALALAGSVFGFVALLVTVGGSSHQVGEPALDPRLNARASSRLSADGSLEPGAAVTRGTLASLPEAQQAAAALALIPDAFAPRTVLLELDPSLAPGVPTISGIECHGQSGALLLGSSAHRLPKSVWLHELAHVRLHGARPQAVLAKRVITALEEGIADDYAAVLGGSPVLGSDGEERDLRQPPNVGPSDWASLAFPNFDPHRLGWALGAALFAAEPRAGALLEGALACLDGPGPLRDADSPVSAITSLLQSCPEPGRERFQALLRCWLPPAFLNESSP